jgi:hypothetical protein
MVADSSWPRVGTTWRDTPRMVRRRRGSEPANDAVTTSSPRFDRHHPAGKGIIAHMLSLTSKRAEVEVEARYPSVTVRIDHADNLDRCRSIGSIHKERRSPRWCPAIRGIRRGIVNLGSKAAKPTPIEQNRHIRREDWNICRRRRSCCSAKVEMGPGERKWRQAGTKFGLVCWKLGVR